MLLIVTKNAPFFNLAPPFDGCVTLRKLPSLSFTVTIYEMGTRVVPFSVSQMIYSLVWIK
jgi:hypothetical protein